MTEHLFEPPPPEPKRNTFIKRLETSTILYSSIPTKNPRGKEASFLGNVDPGLEVEINGKSWQQFCKGKDTRKNPNDVWVFVKVVSPNSPFEGRQAVVTMGDLTRLPEKMKQENQPKQSKLTGRVSGNSRTVPEKQPTPTPEVQSKSEISEKKFFIQKVLIPVRLFKEHPKPKAEDENERIREEYLKEIELGRTHGEIEMTVEGSWDDAWTNNPGEHYLKGKVTYIKEGNKDIDFFGKEAIVSKGEAARKPQGYNGPSGRRDKSGDHIPF